MMPYAAFSADCNHEAKPITPDTGFVWFITSKLCSLIEETVWLTQAQMITLFGKARATITEHIQNVFKESEL